MYKFHWYTKPNNFGDILTPCLLDHFGIQYKKTKTIEEADAISIGSIARLAVDNQIVLGSGRIRKNEIANPNADWWFVRGPLTRENVIKHGGYCPEIYGDPALLLPLFCKESKKKYDVGLVPHYQHFSAARKKYGGKYKIIDVVNTNPLEVAKEITQCRKIISGSLHGIIAAHAYGIPAAWVEFGKMFGDGTKFEDHYLSVGLDPVKSRVDRPNYSVPEKLNLAPIIEKFESLKDASIRNSD